LDRYFTKPIEKETIKVITDTTYVTDTVTQVIPFKLLSKETVIVDTSRSINYDSLITEAFKEWQSSIKDTILKDYIVKADTTLPDSVVSLSISFHSPLPIHPKSYFVNKITTKIPVIKEIITIEKTVSPLLSYGINTGVGYMIFNNKIDVYVGMGLQLNLGSIF